MAVKSKVTKAEAVKFLEELKALFDRYNADITCGVAEGQFEMETIRLDLSDTRICEFYNPACVSAGDIEELLQNKPLGHRWLIEEK